jgi:hypothetical protein
MFVQSKAETNHKHKNGVAIRQRRAHTETLVQWENGRQYWVQTDDLQGNIKLIGEDCDNV